MHPVEWLMNKEAAMSPAQARRHLQNIMNIQPAPLTLKDKLMMGGIMASVPASILLANMAAAGDLPTAL